MKKLILLFLIPGLFLASCDKENDTAEKFSTRSVEENKALVEESGVEFVEAMQRMEELESITVMQNFSDLNSSIASKVATGENSKVLSTFDALISAARGRTSLNTVFDAMASPGELKSVDPETLEDYWNESLGTYSWNRNLGEWEYTAGGDEIIWLFPSSETSLTNDASLTFSDYEGVVISNPLEDDYAGDLPASLHVELNVGSDVLMTYVFAAEYNTDGVPGMIASDLTVETFKFEIDFTNNASKVSVNYKLLEGDNTIIDLGVAGEGDFTEANYDANTETYTDTYTYEDYVYNAETGQYETVIVTETEEWTETEFEEILNSANAHFQILNIALRGDINVKGLVDEIRNLDEQGDNIEEEEYYNALSEKINETLNLRLVNTTNNEIIAKAEAYVVNETFYTYEDYWIDFRLTFGDGSPVDMQTYFEEGFEDFVTEINELIQDINTDFGTEIDPVVY